VYILRLTGHFREGFDDPGRHLGAPLSTGFRRPTTQPGGLISGKHYKNVAHKDAQRA
jgi:hypothetical protein